MNTVGREGGSHRQRGSERKVLAEKGGVRENKRVMWTDSVAIDKIAREGFKIGGTEGVAIKSGATFGSGVYTAVNPDISVGYSRGSNMMLLSRCIKGSYRLHHTHGGSNDVLVIKNVSQLLPRYVVHYSWSSTPNLVKWWHWKVPTGYVLMCRVARSPT